MADRAGGAGDLWSFALKVYGAADVSASCLALQDRFGADVPVLLTALWMAQRGVRLDASGMAEIERRIGPWRTEMVAPLRALRRRLKSDPPLPPSEETEALRTDIKRAELYAEKIELATLAGWVDAMSGWDGHGGFRENLAVAMAHYAGDADVPEALQFPLLAAAEAA